MWRQIKYHYYWKQQQRLTARITFGQVSVAWLPPPDWPDLFSLSLSAFAWGNFSRCTRCITVVFFGMSLSAPIVTFPCKNRPWYISLRVSERSGLCASGQSSGQFDQTWSDILAAELFKLNLNCAVFPVTISNFSRISFSASSAGVTCSVILIAPGLVGEPGGEDSRDDEILVLLALSRSRPKTYDDFHFPCY